MALSKLGQLRSHSAKISLTTVFAVGKDEAKKLGLQVAEDTREIEEIIWKIWVNFEAELDVRTRFSPIHVLMQSLEGPKLGGTIPQVSCPPGTPPQLVQEAYKAAIKTELISPVDVDLVIALVESPRMASKNVDKRKIFASRSPDLKIQWNSISVWNGWCRELLPR